MTDHEHHPQRPRRLRTTAAMRRLVAENRLAPADLVLPVFYRQGLTSAREIPSMPGVFQHDLDSLRAHCAEAVEAGCGGIMVFAVPAERDERGSAATDPEGPLAQAVSVLASDLGDRTVLMADLCLDEFTSHGHCGVVDERSRVDNDATLDTYGRMAVVLGQAGAHVLGTSGMMDGQVGAVRSALDREGLIETSVLAYAAKYASAFYGPFRDAVESALSSDRRTYQQDPANGREGVREALLDIDEGADLVMVKPAGSYLDVVRAVREISPVPVAAYQVSGEYSMIEAAAARGWIDRTALIDESLIAIKRAGADVLCTYYALEYARRQQS